MLLSMYCKSLTRPVIWEFVSQSGRLDMNEFGDSNLAGDTRDRKSTSGYRFMVAGGATSWYSRTPSVFATFTCGAEYKNLIAACKNAIWLRHFMTGIVSSCRNGMTILSEHKKAIILDGSEGINRPYKHIDATYHILCDVVYHSKVRLGYKSSSKMFIHAQRNHYPRQYLERPTNWQVYKARKSMIPTYQRGVLLETRIHSQLGLI